MPEQNEPTDEHELIQEIAEPLSKLPDDPVAIARDVHFPVSLRGYDRIAVDAYVKHTTQLVAELQATRSPEAAVRRALERVGEEVSGILQRAQDAAEKIHGQSSAEAQEHLEQARREALVITAEAERRVVDLDAQTDAIWAERERIVRDIGRLADRLTALARSALERFPAEEDAEHHGPASTETRETAGSPPTETYETEASWPEADATEASRPQTDAAEGPGAESHQDEASSRPGTEPLGGPAASPGRAKLAAPDDG